MRPEFADAATRGAAELIAFDTLNPTLRSRGSVTQAAQELLTDAFKAEMTELFSGHPDGHYTPMTLENLAQLVGHLQRRIEKLEGEIAALRHEDSLERGLSAFGAAA